MTDLSSRRASVATVKRLNSQEPSSRNTSERYLSVPRRQSRGLTLPLFSAC